MTPKKTKQLFRGQRPGEKKVPNTTAPLAIVVVGLFVTHWESFTIY